MYLLKENLRYGRNDEIILVMERFLLFRQCILEQAGEGRVETPQVNESEMVSRHEGRQRRQGRWARQQRARYHRQHRWNLVSDEKAGLGQRGTEKDEEERRRSEARNAEKRTRRYNGNVWKRERKKRNWRWERRTVVAAPKHPCVYRTRVFSRQAEARVRFAWVLAPSLQTPQSRVTPLKSPVCACSCLCCGCNNVLTYWSTQEEPREEGTARRKQREGRRRRCSQEEEGSEEDWQAPSWTNARIVCIYHTYVYQWLREVRRVSALSVATCPPAGNKRK